MRSRDTYWTLVLIGKSYWSLSCIFCLLHKVRKVFLFYRKSSYLSSLKRTGLVDWMKHQKVSVDLWNVTIAATQCLALAFTGWVFLRLVNACIWLPAFLRDSSLKKKED